MLIAARLQYQILLPQHSVAVWLFGLQASYSVAKPQQCILAREEGVDRWSYLGITWSQERKVYSWWVSLSLHRRDATVWTVEAVPECPHHVTISLDVGGSKRVYLTAIGDSKEGTETCLEEDSFAVIVDKPCQVGSAYSPHGEGRQDFPLGARSCHRICFDRPLLS